MTAIAGTINRNTQLPPQPPGAPGMFRCAQNGLVQGLLEQAGLKNTSEKEVTGTMKCGTRDVYRNMMTEIAAPFVAALSTADDATKEKIKRGVYQVVGERYPDGNVMIDSSALLICGEK